MTPERWQQIDDIYTRALEREPESRHRFLDEVCAGDAELRREIESLLAASQHTSFSLDRPAMDVAAQAIARDRSDGPTRDSGGGRLPSLGDRYVVLAEAGRGGMGIVYRVEDRETEEVVAVKVLHADIAGDRSMLDRFKGELKLSRRVTHRNVCRIYDINRAGALTYISMEFVAGESLRRVLNRLGALTVKKGVDVIRQICEGLREAHAQGIIHRDLKPENIMIDEVGNVKVMDFGIARLLSNPRTLTMIAGTPSYMAPEQLAGRAADERSDIYTLGLVAYEMLTGRAAYAESTPVAVAARQMREAPPSPRLVAPAIPADVEAVILRCIERDPARRFPSLDAVLAALPAPTANPHAVSVPVKPRTSKISDWFVETAQIMAPGKARALLLVIQSGYLALYLVTLYHLAAAFKVLEMEMGLSQSVTLFVPFLAMAGIATRIFLLSALAFNHPATGKQYWKLFPLLLLLDAMWAAAPLLLVPRIGVGLALVFASVMAYLPFSQKTLFSNAYP